jgi:hypothetical protein
MQKKNSNFPECHKKYSSDKVNAFAPKYGEVKQ